MGGDTRQYRPGCRRRDDDISGDSGVAGVEWPGSGHRHRSLSRLHRPRPVVSRCRLADPARCRVRRRGPGVLVWHLHRRHTPDDGAGRRERRPRHRGHDRRRREPDRRCSAVYDHLGGDHRAWGGTPVPQRCPEVAVRRLLAAEGSRRRQRHLRRGPLSGLQHRQSHTGAHLSGGRLRTVAHPRCGVRAHRQRGDPRRGPRTVQRRPVRAHRGQQLQRPLRDSRTAGGLTGGSRQETTPTATRNTWISNPLVEGDYMLEHGDTTETAEFDAPGSTGAVDLDGQTKGRGWL